MSSHKITITLESDLLVAVDALVKKHLFPSRSRAIQEAVKEKLDRINHNLLAQECLKLEPDYEKRLADEGLADEGLADEGLEEDFSEWPKY
ncbi:ribbon-helix-helix domain-containing protein [Candidatus Venteria ishoeyi]|uniref:Putative nickel-responsive regulator n=1 Tax=Candidatus Venteria ishoeyi TaxID=1899563 RepID=A0A1H6F4H1_9GAMM|nr:ribbon-helix-helix domain-containing protein [Candidatus Venteria ishoeyi]SEH05057.1 Putative nickel-responsive regulator [Candidatus Venteria ishoeyi]